VTQKIWEEEGKIKSTGEINGEKYTAIIDLKGGYSYVYIEGSDFIFRSRERPDSSPDRTSQRLPKDNLKIIGSEILDGNDCAVLEYKTDEFIMKMWVWKEKGIVLKSVIKSLLEEGSPPVTITYKNIQIVDDIPDEEFVLPDLRVVDISSS
ncbi:MAG: DUF2092 domain-containing protein, partial [Candidatus Micrarchaeota archaeon]|nr:DUF2092 domain-containing protein [Candidatus Micrarchaeota archaeon]